MFFFTKKPQDNIPTKSEEPPTTQQKRDQRDRRVAYAINREVVARNELEGAIAGKDSTIVGCMAAEQDEADSLLLELVVIEERKKELMKLRNGDSPKSD